MTKISVQSILRVVVDKASEIQAPTRDHLESVQGKLPF